MLKYCMIGVIGGIVYLTFSQTVSAVAVGVTPGNLDFDVQTGSSDTRLLFVINTGTETANYRVYVDEDYADWFFISPETFHLNAGENKAVELTLTPPMSAKGEYDCTVYAVSSSPSSDFSVGSGIRVPVHATVSNSGIFIVLFIVLVSAGVLQCMRKKA